MKLALGTLEKAVSKREKWVEVRYTLYTIDPQKFNPVEFHN